jgi:triosephosphate isomerase (TIM)
MDRINYIAGNWKMHKTLGEAENLTASLKEALADCPNKLMIAPPFTALETVSKVVKGSNILLGAQNMSFQEEGAHTGEISVNMLQDIGVSVVILGHSERRHTYGETDQFVNQKVKLALKHGLQVILCVGETLEEREADKVNVIVGNQLEKGLADVEENEMEGVTIAYEPVWAIGTGKTATPEDADAVHSFIRKKLAGLYSKKISENTVIQYGGSVKPKNIKDLMSMDNIDGALVGGASLESETFAPIAWFNK